MYKVLERFRDGADPEHHVYVAGDLYPREGYNPTAERIAELGGKDNAMKKPIIDVPKPPRSRKAATK